MFLKVVRLTFHEDDHHIQKLLEGKVAIAVLVSQCEHGVHKQGVRFETQSISELSSCQLTLENLPGPHARDTTQVPSVTLLYLQHLYKQIVPQ